MSMSNDYPVWIYYPRWHEPAGWVSEIIDIFKKNRNVLDSTVSHKKSNEALSYIRSDLESFGFDVEGGQKQTTISRPVHFGECGNPDLKYQIDAYHPGLKIALEIEAGRSTRGNAIYRDIIQTSLLVGVDFFAIAVPQKYSFNVSGKVNTDDTYKKCKSIFDAVYSSQRLKLPMSGVLLIGY